MEEGLQQGLEAKTQFLEASEYLGRSRLYSLLPTPCLCPALFSQCLEDFCIPWNLPPSQLFPLWDPEGLLVLSSSSGKGNQTSAILPHLTLAEKCQEQIECFFIIQRPREGKQLLQSHTYRTVPPGFLIPAVLLLITSHLHSLTHWQGGELKVGEDMGKPRGSQQLAKCPRALSLTSPPTPCAEACAKSAGGKQISSGYVLALY